MDGADESGRRPGLRLLWVSGLMGFLLCNWVDGFENLNVTKHQFMDGYGFSTPPLMVGLSLIAGAASTGAGILLYFLVMKDKEGKFASLCFNNVIRHQWRSLDAFDPLPCFLLSLFLC